MAKFGAVAGKRTGSVGGETYAVVRGQNIVKAKIVDQVNPRTKTQQTQRGKFANAVSFYKLATQNFFKFAFEDKKQVESDFNAFMRNNVSRALLVSPSSVGRSVPAVSKFLLTKGNLQALGVVGFNALPSSTKCIMGSWLNVDFDATSFVAPTTIGGLSSLFIAQGWASAGDIITVVGVWFDGTITSGQIAANADALNHFKYVQLVIDTTDARTFAEAGLDVTITADEDFLGVDIKIPIITFAENEASLIASGSIIYSRRFGSKLEVSTSELKLCGGAQTAYNLLTSDSSVDAFLSQWLAVPGAILAGGK